MSTLDERREHLAAIQKIVDDWLDGKITVRQKRTLIERENEFFYGDHPASLTDDKIDLIPGAVAERELVLATQGTLYGEEEEEGFWWQRDSA